MPIMKKITHLADSFKQVLTILFAQGQIKDNNSQTQATMPAQPVLGNNIKDLWSVGSSPINIEKVSHYLNNYTNRDEANFLLHGLTLGFKLQYSGPRRPLFSKNLLSASENWEALQEKLDKEVQEGRMVGPFKDPPLRNLHVSPIGVIPKADGGWRMITHLSYPPSNSINSHIDPVHTTVKYTSFDTVIHTISDLGKGSKLAKVDIKNAFRLLRVYPGDFELLGMFFRGGFYIDKCLPFGCSISCKIFETFAVFLEWAIKERTGLDTVHHYLDDFIFIGSENTDHCSQLMTSFEIMCSEFGIPLNKDKTLGPTTSLIFLGLEIDTISMQIRIPAHKVIELSQLLNYWVNKEKIIFKELESLVGKLNFFGKAIPGSRAFIRRFYNAMLGPLMPYHHIRITKSLREDMKIWLQFLEHFNGIVIFPDTEWSTPETLQLFTDSTGSENLGCGCYFQGQWTYFQWPAEWQNSQILKDITFLELIPIVLAFMIWGVSLSSKMLILHIDNISLVHILNKQSSKSDRVMSLLRPLMLMSLKNNIQFKAQHIPGKSNIIADAISRKQWEVFRKEAPSADLNPQLIPAQFQRVISMVK